MLVSSIISQYSIIIAYSVMKKVLKVNVDVFFSCHCSCSTECKMPGCLYTALVIAILVWKPNGRSYVKQYNHNYDDWKKKTTKYEEHGSQFKLYSQSANIIIIIIIKTNLTILVSKCFCLFVFIKELQKPILNKQCDSFRYKLFV